MGESRINRLLKATSITEDEAVSMLVGYTAGPVEFEPMDDDADADANCPVFCLEEILEEELEKLDSKHQLAIDEEQPADVIAKTLSALNSHQEIIKQANIHLCALRDELNKGERSVLKVDSALSNAVYTYITRHSFDEWVERRASVSAGAADAETPSATSAAPTAVITKRAPGTKQRDRRDAIFAVIVSRDLNPKALPNFNLGNAGLRADIREAVQALELFKGSPRLFNRAWGDLFDQEIDGRLAYEE